MLPDEVVSVSSVSSLSYWTRDQHGIRCIRY